MDKQKIKDNVAVLFIFYFTGFCFWFNHRKVIRINFLNLDFYLFFITLLVLCISPIIILEYRARRNI